MHAEKLEGGLIDQFAYIGQHSRIFLEHFRTSKNIFRGLKACGDVGLYDHQQGPCASAQSRKFERPSITPLSLRKHY